MKQRWYDKDPVLSLAISLLQNSDIQTRHKCADLIIETALENGVTLPNSIADAVNYMLRRWYDKDDILSQAMEYIKCSDEELRTTIATKVIEFLQNV